MMSETIALSRKKQSRFTKKIRNVKEKVNKGVIKIKENNRKQKPKIVRGLIYIGHIPHGFYEKEMEEYFKQFGAVTNVRVCRSRKTGRSKGYGFVQFFHPEVAQIAAETMDNYLMFNRRLICKNIPPEKQRGYMFRKIQWSTKYYPLKIARKAHFKKRNENPSNEKFIDTTKKILNKFKKKMNKLKELGVKYSFRLTDMPDDVKYLLHENKNDDSSNVTVEAHKNKNIDKRAQKQKSDGDFKVTKISECDLYKELKKKSLKTIMKKKDRLKKSTLPKISFMQNERLKRLAAVEIVNEALVNKIDRIKKFKVRKQK